MQKFAIYALAAMLALPISVASAAQSHQKPSSIPPSPLGFSTLICTADGTGGVSLPPGFTIGVVSVTGTTPLSTGSPGVYTIDVNMDNGTHKSNDYVVTFIDNDGSQTLNCGDTIVSIAPASIPNH